MKTNIITKEIRKYDEKNNLVYSDINGFKTFYEYNENGKITKYSSPSEHLEEIWNYDENGNCIYHEVYRYEEDDDFM